MEQFVEFFNLFYICFYKSWYPENIAEKPSNDFDFGNFSHFCLIRTYSKFFFFFFIIQYRIENGEKNTLIETKVETVGIIISGAFYESRSLKGRRSNDAEITIKFKTKDKKKKNYQKRRLKLCQMNLITIIKGKSQFNLFKCKTRIT